MALPDFLRIGRRDRRDAVGELQPRLEESDSAVIFDAVDGEGLRRQAEGGEDLGGKLALEGEVMHGHHRAGARAPAVLQISGGEARLPVVGVDDLRREARDEALAERGADFRERREAKSVVHEVAAVRSGIGAAVAVIEVRGVEHEKIERAGAADEHAGGAAEQILEFRDGLGLFQRRQHRAVAGAERAQRDLFGEQRAGQGAGDVGEAAGLDQRIDFGRDRKRDDRFHDESRSIIGWVTRQTPDVRAAEARGVEFAGPRR